LILGVRNRPWKDYLDGAFGQIGMGRIVCEEIKQNYIL
jgi:hypothetical protein